MDSLQIGKKTWYSFSKVYGNSASVNTHCYSYRIKNLPGVLAGYFSNDILNVDETG